MGLQKHSQAPRRIAQTCLKSSARAKLAARIIRYGVVYQAMAADLIDRKNGFGRYPEV